MKNMFVFKNKQHNYIGTINAFKNIVCVTGMIAMGMKLKSKMSYTCKTHGYMFIGWDR